MVILTADAIDVHSHSGGLGKALQAMGHHLAAQLAEPLALETEIDDGIWSVRQVDDGAG
jgi:hypothetical protein